MRLIDADVLKEALKKPILMDNEKANRIWEGWHECTIAVDEAINAQPTIESEQRWIPCSERLPHGSCSDLVNVSIHDDSGDTPYDYTSCGWVTTDGEYWIVDGEINNHVVAWMPLPEPWRGEEE